MSKKEIKVGDYVRTDYGEIHRVAEIVEDPQDMNYYKYENKMGDFEICIEKHSKNIIDLIEVGDYVNGREVDYCYDYDEDGNDIEDLGILYNEEDNQYLPLNTIEIKTILTKEKYENNCYKVVE